MDKLNLWYLELPIVANYHVRLGNFGIVPFGGVYYSYCVKGTLKALDQKVSWTQSEDGMTKRIRRSDLGIRLGCGFSYRHLYLSLGYDLGLSNVAYKYILENHIDRIPSERKQRTGSFITTIGWNF